MNNWIRPEHINLLFITLLATIFSPDWAQAQSYDVMSFNIRYDNPKDGEDRWDLRKSELAAMIKFYDPAILGIQEGLHHQVTYLDSALSNHRFIGTGRDDGAESGEYTALFFDTTLLSLVNTSTFWLSENPEKVSVGWDASMERICTYGLFEDKSNGKKMFVFNTHFDHIGKEARKKSAQLIAEFINQLNVNDMAVTLMGDFNALPHSPPIIELKKVMNDGADWSKSGLSGSAGTFTGFNNQPPDNRIDYVFTHKLDVWRYIHVSQKRANNRPLSDHLPVLATVRHWN